MEPFPKRQRLFAPAHRDFTQSFVDQQEYYDETPDSEMLEEEEEEDFGDEAEPENDPDMELEQRRARLDYKLKSTFEAIFEKYGKDFDGVGDEIDLATGEILVDNGHLTEMQDERDAGDVSKARNTLRAFTIEPEDLPTSSVGETDMLDGEDDDDEDEEDYTSEDGTVDDDMILRGFAKANRFVQASPELEASPELAPQEHLYEEDRRSSMKGNALPSRSDILLQFGPQLGPHIAEFVSQQQVPDSLAPDDSHIEPAWRVPKIPLSRPVKRPVKRPVTLPPEPERSPSPEAAASIWAPANYRGSRKIDKGSRVPKSLHDSMALDPLSDPIGFGYGHTPESAPRRTRKNFTAQDDEILLNFAEQARRQNLELWSISTWRRLEDMHSHHSATSWRARYKLKFTYLWPNEADEPESSETSVDTTHRIDQPNSVMGRSMIEPRLPVMPPVHDRPNRIRKPAEKDSRIISWSQAVDAIESVDPDLHAGILEDSRAMENSRVLERTVSLSFGQDTGTLRIASANQPRPESNHSIPSHQSDRAPHPQKRGEVSSDFMAVDTILDSNQSVIPCAPCPHADCKALLSNIYRLQRQEDEDLSEMCLHLFHQHHTTPFPCGEINCSRKGEDGFFMQVDLVRHVKLSHPSAGALQRLRGRVNPELLDRHIKLTRPPEKTDSPVKPSKHVGSDFMSPSQIRSVRLSSNAQFSSSSGGDRTVTPRMTNGTLGASESTPMTSVSSMVVHPSSGMTAILAQNSESQGSPHLARADSHIEEDARIQSHSAAFVNQATSSVTPAQVLGTRQLSDPFRREPARGSLPTPQASVGGSLGPSSAVVEKRITGRSEIRIDRPSLAHQVNSGSKVPLPTCIPDSQSSEVTFPFSSFDVSSKPKDVRADGVPNSFFRPIDPSYEFSDEEDAPSMPRPTASKTTAPPFTSVPATAKTRSEVTKAIPTCVKTSSIPTKPTQVLSPFKSLSRVHAIKSSASRNTSAKSSPAITSKTKSMPPPTTPASKARAQLRKSVIPDSYDADDFDELSSEQFGLLSHQRTNPQPKANPILTRVKKVESSKTPQVHSAPSQKRKLDAFQEPTVTAKPVAVAQAAPTKEAPTKEAPQTDPAIKTEADETTTLPTLASTKKVGRPRKIPVASTPKKSPFPKSLDRGARTSTPLLDLTPSRKHPQTEIRDSDDEEESSSPLTPKASKPQTKTKTETRAKVVAKTPLPPRTKTQNKPWDKAPIVLRTPGGTLRKCGEDGFRCHKGFCFACGVESQERKMRKGKGKA